MTNQLFVNILVRGANVQTFITFLQKLWLFFMWRASMYVGGCLMKAFVTQPTFLTQFYNKMIFVFFVFFWKCRNIEIFVPKNINFVF